MANNITSAGTYAFDIVMKDGCEIEFTPIEGVTITPTKGGTQRYTFKVQDGANGRVVATVNGDVCDDRSVDITTPKCDDDECTCYIVSPSTSSLDAPTAATISWAYSAITWTKLSNCDVSSSKTESTSSTTVTFDAPTCDSHTKSDTIIWEGHNICGNEWCSDNVITIPWSVEQGEPAGCKCDCDKLQVPETIQPIPSDGLGVDSIITTYNILDNCPVESYTATLVNKDVATETYEVSLSNNNVVLGKRIPPIELGGQPKTFVLQFYYNNNTHCNKLKREIPQLAEICDCEHANGFVKMFKQTFTTGGTEGQLFKIGSGETSCGILMAKVCSSMLEVIPDDGDKYMPDDAGCQAGYGNIRTENLGKGDDGRYRFNFWVIVKENETPSTLPAGVWFRIVNEDGQPLTDYCSEKFSILQTTNACVCNNCRDVEVISNDSNWWSIQLEDDTYCVRYENNSTQICFESVGTYYTKCKAFYVDYDEEIFETRSPQGHIHWWSGTSKRFAIFLKPSVILTENTTYNFRVTEYVDAKVTDGELEYGYMCGGKDFKVLIFTDCTCEIEEAAAYSYYETHTDRYIDIDAGAGTTTVREILYCAGDADMELTFESGVDDWATITKGGEAGEWIINYDANDSGKEREAYVNIIPIINGKRCKSKNIYELDQSVDVTCTRCEDIIDDIKIWKLEYSEDCDSDYITNISPIEYRGNCNGELNLRVIGSSTNTPLSNIWNDPERPGKLKANNNKTNSEWKFTIKATYSTVDDENCIDNCEITILPCTNECFCYKRKTQFSFTKVMTDDCVQSYQDRIRTIVIGTVGEVDSSDYCIGYGVKVTQGADVRAYIDGRTVKVDIQPNADNYISMIVSLNVYENGSIKEECQISDAINFDVKPNCG